MQKLTRLIFSLCFTWSLILPSMAQTNAQTPKTVLPDPVSGPEPAPVILPQVVSIKPVYSVLSQEQTAREDNLSINNSNQSVAVYPGNIIRFTISNPMAFLNSRPTDNSKVVLYVNGVEMKGIVSDWMSQITRLQINSGQLPALGNTADIFIALRRNDSTRGAWQFFYGNTGHFYDNFANLNASIGWQGMSELQKVPGAPRVTIIYYRIWVFLCWMLLFVIVLGLFVYICGFTDALKDGGRGGAYSLSLSQLMFWTTLVIGAFIYTLVLTDIVTTFNTSILLLLGVSAGTTGLAYVIDSNFAKNNPGAAQKKHETFLKDILTDGNGYSVQRIQAFAWNLVLGMYFIIYTIDNKSMPEFSSTILFLAGISSASYLGAKGPENTNATRPVAAAGGPPTPASDSSAT
ncbi:hypothetical protein LX99_04826 [Mucilaginibacter oryzae]|uniref:Uncharacterized protein n=1 Tax=Mucilaginibacter oryzae TaxID=468058 RepID=A0A316GW34_9SPHI|nr:hypothetical protein [Mucilaginibacter oryzae]PWK68301.1 hypothetical protein LX99_04826 [Mucilaginibacter oryzae]